MRVCIPRLVPRVPPMHVCTCASSCGWHVHGMHAGARLVPRGLVRQARGVQGPPRPHRRQGDVGCLTRHAVFVSTSAPHRRERGRTVSSSMRAQLYMWCPTPGPTIIGDPITVVHRRSDRRVAAPGGSAHWRHGSRSAGPGRVDDCASTRAIPIVYKYGRRERCAQRGPAGTLQRVSHVRDHSRVTEIRVFAHRR